MNKKDLAEKVQSITEGTKVQSEEIVDAIFDAIADAMKRREQVAVPGFGKFEARHRAARTARNPRTGEAVQVPASYAPKFSPAKALKDAVK